MGQAAWSALGYEPAPDAAAPVFKRKRDTTTKKTKEGLLVMTAAYDSEDDSDDDAPIQRMETIVTEEMMAGMMAADGDGDGEKDPDDVKDAEDGGGLNVRISGLLYVFLLPMALLCWIAYLLSQQLPSSRRVCWASAAILLPLSLCGFTAHQVTVGKSKEDGAAGKGRREGGRRERKGDEDKKEKDKETSVANRGFGARSCVIWRRWQITRPTAWREASIAHQCAPNLFEFIRAPQFTAPTRPARPPIRKPHLQETTHQRTR